MTADDAKLDTGFHAALAAGGRSPEIPEEADLYGWLIGSWDLQVRHYLVDVSARGIRAEAHFGWVLEGRAVQDVWIMPDRGSPARSLPPEKTLNMYGTTLRIWDASSGAWRVTWFNPVTGGRNELVARRCAADIVQVGTHADGTPIRWCFTEITPRSFRWIGEVLAADAKTWKLQGEFLATRRADGRHAAASARAGCPA
jgi:hypothetical protein